MWHPEDPGTGRWIGILAGLLIGLSAKYAIMMQDGRKIRGRSLIVDLLLLAANALMASILVARLGLGGQEAVAVAALFGASSDRIVRVVRNVFERRVEKSVATIFATEEQVVPPSAAPVEVKDMRNAPQTPAAQLLDHLEHSREIAGELEPLEDLLRRLRVRLNLQGTDLSDQELLELLRHEKGAGET